MPIHPHRSELEKLGASELADTLLQLAANSESAMKTVERLLATPAENLKRCKAMLSGLKRRRKFVDWRESSAFAAELEFLLLDIQASVTEAKEGVKLVGSFYQADHSIFNRADDSSGQIGDVFRYSAQQLFRRFAQDCSDKAWVGKYMLKLVEEDDFGIRDSVIEIAGDCLPEAVLREMIQQLQKTAASQTDSSSTRHALSHASNLAKQLNDAPLFDELIHTGWRQTCEEWEDPDRHHPDVLPVGRTLEIAQVYFQSGDPESALNWLNKIPADESFMRREIDELTLQIHRQLGNQPELEAITGRHFRKFPSVGHLDALIEVIGEGQRPKIVAEATQAILRNPTFSSSAAEFLLEVGEIQSASAYVRQNVDQIEGGYYPSLRSLAEALQTHQDHLGASILYRALLSSILTDGRPKAYSHGVRYLRKLDELATSIIDWEKLPDHTVFLATLRLQHGRKRSFWFKYD
ncbi:MAG: hypothetical protein HQ519_01020 [Planctomycetes bacterium]|nr:hypothetical protein [Planctomycetota bacterium]